MKNFYVYNDTGRFVAIVTAEDEDEAMVKAKEINPHCESVVPAGDVLNKFARVG